MGAVVIAAGGTGGHLYPALAVAAELRALSPDLAIFFAGSADRLEARVVPAAGYPFAPVASGPWRRGNPVSLLTGLAATVRGAVQAGRLLGRTGADCVFSSGGWTAAPVLLAATVRGVPIVLHEPNRRAGVVTRAFSRFAARVTAADAGVLPGATVTGIPVRRELQGGDKVAARRTLGLPGDAVVVLVQGGSQGAAAINAAVADALPDLKASGVALIWLCGRGAEAEMTSRAAACGIPARVFGYCDGMATVLAAADLTVARAGASTLAEITAAGLPSILVPYPHAADDHQRRNAEALAAAGAAIVVQEADLDGAWLGATILALAHHPRRADMAVAARSLGRPDAAAAVAREILSVLGGGAAC